MIQIMIKWDFISPVLQTISGIVTVYYISAPSSKRELIAEFRTKCEPESREYESISDKGIPTFILDAIKPQLDIMVGSYRDGVILNKDTFTRILKEDLDKANHALTKIPSKIRKPTHRTKE